MGKQLTINNVGLIVAGGALAVVAINELHPLHSNSIYLLLAAGVGAILPHLSSFKAGGVEVTLREIENRVQEVKKTMTENRERNQSAQADIQNRINDVAAEAASAQADIQNRINDVAAEAARAVKREARLVWEVGGVPGGAQKVRQRSFAPANIEATAPKTEAEEAPATDAPTEQEPASATTDDAALLQLVRSLKVPKNLDDDDDTWALVDEFKDLPAANSTRALTAEVTPDSDDPDWYRVRITLAPVGSGAPIVGRVYFLIHHTFPKNKVPAVASNGTATLERYAYGAFTVVALADGGNTKLKLDLAQLPNLPKEFAEG
ncbi:MAG: hypothetical protein IPM61_04450 [Chlorobi bacterium]|nr:MAG: hypothetical protein UZ07_CHB004001170 [Chlorobi bacterium OLB7]MBK8910560.1 hypothetical protein [Chlorobiota bacterium]MBX7217432.1 hypothetical protein [Candidatus Kapabacteria bacterium]